jgi:hypothetical protein
MTVLMDPERYCSLLFLTHIINNIKKYKVRYHSYDFTLVTKLVKALPPSRPMATWCLADQYIAVIVQIHTLHIKIFQSEQ